MSDLLDCVEVGPADAKHSVLWLHGLGASGHDFEPLVPALGLDHVRFVFPHAPMRPVTINMGMVMRAWYDITSLDAGARNREPEADIRAAHVQVEALLERERTRGVAPEHQVVAGFSQGGAMALFTANRHPQALAGIMVLSAYQLLPHTYADEATDANRSTPMLFCHGSLDPVVPMKRGKRAHDAVEVPGRELAWHDYPMAHEVCPEEVAEIRRWLHARMNP